MPYGSLVGMRTTLQPGCLPGRESVTVASFYSDYSFDSGAWAGIEPESDGSTSASRGPGPAFGDPAHQDQYVSAGHYAA